jgi:pimeloyl-ACP methyl ester carboxylesterase
MTALKNELPEYRHVLIDRAGHGLIVEKPELLARMTRDLHQTERTNGVAPIRRD